MMKLEAKVCPWNEPNSYGEIMQKGTFARFLAAHPMVPMLIMHSGRPVGMWTDIEERDDGMWANGISPADPTKAMLDAVPELSISWRSDDGIMTERRFEDFKRCGVYVPRHAKIVTEHAPRNAGLGEISLVDKGSFDGTFYRVQA